MACGPGTLVFYVNGKRVEENSPDPEMTLLTYLRTKLLLPGAKLGCGEGACGACTVMLSRYDWSGQHVDHLPINACLAPLCVLHGMAVTTVEGIGSTKTSLHPVQERIAASFGSQCGFCTPGIVMRMYTLLRNNPDPTREEMVTTFEGNLCRCTGYRPILDGFESLTKEYKMCGMGDQCCKNQSKKSHLVETPGKLYDACKFKPYEPSQEPIFPSELQMNETYDRTSLVFHGTRVTWYRPTTLEELLSLKAAHPDARMLVGNTEIGIEVKFKNIYYPVLLAVTHVPDLLAITQDEAGISFGGSTSLTQLEKVLHKAISEEPEYKTRVFAAIVEMLRWFAGEQIRCVAAIAGNIMTASPISDLNPLFQAAGCTLVVMSKDRGQRTVKMDRNFFLGYRKTVLEMDEILVSIHVPYTRKNEYFSGFKQAQRREDDISIVNGGMRVVLNEDTLIVEEIALSFGGMAPITKMATGTMESLIGKTWDDSLLKAACLLLEKDLPLPHGAPGGMETYRRTLTTSFFYKFFLTVLRKYQHKSCCQSIPATHLSATNLYERIPSKGIQVFEQPGIHQAGDDAVGFPVEHRAAQQQATGEAQYIDDIPRRTDELYLCLVTSIKANARLVHVNPEKATAMPGVKAYIHREDIPGNPLTGVAVKDEEIFAKDKVTYEGQVIGAIVAETQAQAQQAANAVIVTYEESEPIITVEQAIEANSYFDKNLCIHKGDVDSALAEARNMLEGEVKIGAQEHFYMETQAVLAIPRGEDGELEVFCSTQNPTHAQMQVAEALAVPANKINIRVKRMGGGFGGKESQYAILLLPVVVAATKLQKPIRCMLDRDEDMLVTGTRHPFLGKYKVGFNDDGTITVLDVQLYSNGGHSLDLSASVLERALLHIDNCYKVLHLRVTGQICKTNISSSTAFRGFGGPQAMFIMEHIISDIGLKLMQKPEVIREINMYSEGDDTHFGQKLTQNQIRRCFAEVREKADYKNRIIQVEEFNRQNRWKKRGITIIPTKFGISFTLFHLNQTGALVHVYLDGSVLISHGGTEMGQGLHTKMVQVASRALGVAVEKIHITETMTATVPNTSATAASAASDLNGMAILNACKTIADNLKPLRESMPNATWEEIVSAAYMEQIGLSSTGYYRTPDIGFDWETGTGRPFNYFTFGAACSEVEIDCLTGDHTVLRTDIVMDVGQSLNPAIDIGQIEGGFIQGYGLFTIEFKRYAPNGYLYSRGPGNYKIPGFGDIPIEFNVSLLKESDNERAVYSSKAIGEPPLFLASSIFFAIKQAVAAARAESDISGPFRFDSPATAWRIRMGCEDNFTQQFPEADPSTYTPWFVNL